MTEQELRAYVLSHRKTRSGCKK
ncbi:DUF6887 family protein [Gloeocapsa sp. PCC 7428]